MFKSKFGCSLDSRAVAQAGLACVIFFGTLSLLLDRMAVAQSTMLDVSSDAGAVSTITFSQVQITEDPDGLYVMLVFDVAAGKQFLSAKISIRIDNDLTITPICLFPSLSMIAGSWGCGIGIGPIKCPDDALGHDIKAKVQFEGLDGTGPSQET